MHQVTVDFKISLHPCDYLSTSFRAIQTFCIFSPPVVIKAHLYHTSIDTSIEKTLIISSCERLTDQLPANQIDSETRSPIAMHVII